MEWITMIIAITTFSLALYHWSTSTFDFWKSRGVRGPSPLPLVGNLKNVLLGILSLGAQIGEIYNDFRDESIIGIFIKRQPAVILVDPDLIKDVLITDFSIFTDRGMGTFDKTEPLSQNLLQLEPARWRPLRKKLSPVFSAGKLQKMFHLLLECSEQLNEYLDKYVVLDGIVECRELTGKFTTDVIGSCLFGLKMNALGEENHEFCKMGIEIFAENWRRTLKRNFQVAAPSLYLLLGSLVSDSILTNYFIKLMRDVMDYRKNNQIVKHDLIDLIGELKNNPDKIHDIELTDTFLAAQMFIFFMAGFETSSTTMSNALYELAQQQSIQDKLRKEINDELAKNNGEITYEVIKSMNYLDMIFKETLRKYPPANVITRKAGENYTFAGTKLTIPQGTLVLIPVFGIHRDSRIYPKPEIFDPERFTKEAIEARHPMHWLGFGGGPRHCIGRRFANYQVKVGLIKILQHYKVQVCEKTQIPYVFDPHAFVLTSIDGVYVKFSKVD